MLHFEDLWQKAESFHKNSDDSAKDILEELTLKVCLYKAIEQRSEISEKDKKEARSHLLGEILFTLTKLSLKEDINVFESLQIILMQQKD